MGMKNIIKTACVACQAGCGLLVYVEEGKITKLSGDPESPVNLGKLWMKMKVRKEAKEEAHAN